MNTFPINYYIDAVNFLPTCAKVYSCIQSFQSPTCHFFVCISICGKQDGVFTQKEAEQSSQVAHVVVVTSEIASIFILNLQAR